MWHTVMVKDTQLAIVHTVCTHLGVRPPPCTCTRLTPSLCANVRTPAYANAPCTLVASWSPGPARTSRDGEVVPAEGEPRTGYADQCAKQHVEAKVTVVGVACAGNVNGRTNRYENKDQSVYGRRSVLVPNGDHSIVAVRCG